MDRLCYEFREWKVSFQNGTHEAVVKNANFIQVQNHKEIVKDIKY